MNFDILVEKVEDLLSEKYYKYSFPKDPEKQMYDFYVLSYVAGLLPDPSGHTDTGFVLHRDLTSDIVDSVNDATKTLYGDLRDELLRSVFYSVCAEMRHADVFKQNRQLFGVEKKLGEVYNQYLKYTLYHQKSLVDREELTKVFNVEKPSSEVRVPEA